MTNPLSDSSPFAYSVVIPTLGSDNLIQTLHALFQSSVPPAEVIIILPPDHNTSLPDLNYPSTRVLNSPQKGQVQQRHHGLSLTNYNYILQLDDDVIVSFDTVRSLYHDLLSCPPLSAIGPTFYNSLTNICWHPYQTGLSGFFETLYQTVVHFFPWGKCRQGTISPSGFACGVDPSTSQSRVLQVQWLAGGCVFSHSSALVNHSQYPFSHKAYSEDLIHSHLRTLSHVSHYVSAKTAVFTPAYPRPLGIIPLYDQYMSQLKATSLINRNPILFSYGYTIDLFRSLLSRAIYHILRLLNRSDHHI